MLKRADFITHDSEGALDRIYCKICGTEIAGTVIRPKGSGLSAGQMVERFMRFSVYADVKFQFDDGSSHVTNGCKDCLNLGLSKKTMLEMYLADCAEQGAAPGKRKPVKVVGLDLTGKGLV